MTEPNTPEKMPFLYVVVCACGLAGDVGKLITAAQERHWDVGVIATPQGLGFLDTEAIEAQTGFPIRSAWRTPGEARPLPPADAIAVAPATFNTVDKWAAGISDTLALGILCEAFGMDIPTAVLQGVDQHGCSGAVSPRPRAEATGATTGAKSYRLLRAIPQTAVDDDLPRSNPCRIKGAGKEEPTRWSCSAPSPPFVRRSWPNCADAVSISTNAPCASHRLLRS
ncbi:flavoprotein [Streptomyces mirabilis]